MKISVFLSYPKPFNKTQEEFVDRITKYLQIRGLEPRTLGVTDYDVDAPLSTIRRLMIESNGLITIAFRRALINSGHGKPGSPEQYDISKQWITSPYSQIEPAMAYQLGLPILILRETGVIADGILERGVIGTYLPEFDLDKPGANYLNSPEWNQIIQKWEGHVRSVANNKGKPPILY